MCQSINIEAFPASVFMMIMETLVGDIGIYKAVLLRPVNKSFNIAILHAICVSQVVDIYDPTTPHVKVDIPPSLKGAILLFRSRSPYATKEELPAVILSVNQEIDRLIKPTKKRRNEQHQIIAEAVARSINPFRVSHVQKELKDIDAETHAQNLLSAAIILGDLPFVKSLLEAPEAPLARVNLDNPYFGRPLQIASARGHMSIVRYLLSHGAQTQGDTYDTDWIPNMWLPLAQKHVHQSPEGSPLRAALHGGHDDIANLLLRPEYRPPLTVLKAEYVQAILAAVRSGLVHFCQRLVRMTGKPLSDYLGLGSKMLREAVAYDQKVVVQMLLDDGVDINAERDPISLSGRSPLRTAASGGNIHMVRFLLDRGADVEPALYGRSAIREAARNGHDEVVELLLERGASQTEAFEDAVDGGQVRLVKRLLSREPDLITEKYGHKYPKHLEKAILHKNPDMISLLVDAGIPLNDGYAREDLPIVLAKTSAAKWVADFLLSLGADDQEVVENARPAYYSEEDVAGLVMCRGVRLTKRTWNWVSRH